MLQCKKSLNDKIHSIRINNGIIKFNNTPYSNCNVFNTYFTNIGSSLAKDLISLIWLKSYWTN